MTLLERLLRGRMPTTQPTERTEAELRARLAEIQAGIAAGEGDALALIEEREEIKLAMEAAQIAREKCERDQYRARITAEANELRGRLHASLDELGDLVPRLLLACNHFDTIAAEVQVKGLGFDAGGQLLEDVFCLPPDFGARLAAAIREFAPRTEWDWGHTGPFSNGVKAERPKLKAPQTMRRPRFAGDHAPPPGFTGTWDLLHGRPLID